MDSPVAQVRAGIDIVELIGEHIALKKAGRTYKALCPFHTEKTPSFVVFPDTARWHCFGCGEGGDAFSFLMKIENLSFSEALRRLADRIGVVVTRPRESEEDKQAQARLFAANEAAAVFYHGLLMNAGEVRTYVAGRGITEGTTREFLLGLAPNTSDLLQRQLVKQDFTADELLRAGLLYEPENGPVRDRYRGRLMFPIRDADGHIVSFGGRALAADQQPKYLNGPQTEIFDKGSILYALNTAAAAIRKERRAVVVEGYVDVVVAHQAGFRNVVATLGTSISERHLRGLARLAPEICLALDADSAGETAGRRTADVAHVSLMDDVIPVPTVAPARSFPGTGRRWLPLIRYQANMRAQLTVARLPEGMDPDELILRDPESWRRVTGEARPIVDHAIDVVARRSDLSTGRGKAEAAETLVPLLLDVADPVLRAHYVEIAGQALRIDSAALVERLRILRAPSRRSSSALLATNPMAGKPVDRYGEGDYAIALAVAAAQRGLPEIQFDAEDFGDPSSRALVLHLQETARSSIGSQWRPDLLQAASEPWLEAPVARVRAALGGVERLTDAQIVESARAMARQLRDARLGVELTELRALEQESDPEDLRRIEARIAEINRERAALHREDAARPRGPAALGSRAAVVPPRFRANELAPAPARPSEQEPPSPG